MEFVLNIQLQNMLGKFINGAENTQVYFSESSYKFLFNIESISINKMKICWVNITHKKYLFSTIQSINAISIINDVIF